MLSYQHAYHAGNAADLHKHVALATLLALITRKPRAISYLESHAGRGVYDLASPEAAKTGEAEAGIARLAPGQGAYWGAIAEVRRRSGPTAYPGSPAIAGALLRPQDRMTLCELHPAENAALRDALGDEGVAIHRRDGHEGLVALTPPTPRRGLALIDPSYEVKDEYARTARTALAVRKRWPEGILMVWFPLLPEERHRELIGGVECSGHVWRHEVTFRRRPERGMTGSGLFFFNLPHRAEEALRAAWRDCEPVFEA